MTPRFPLVLTLALAGAACGRPPRPTVAPSLAPRAPAVAVRSARPTPARAADSVALAPSEVAARVTAMFGSSLTASAQPGGDAAEPAGPTWDIDVRSYETHARVEHYVAVFTGPGREAMAERIERGTRYDPMIRAKLRERGLPEDLTYMALIESGYYPHAYSRAAAVGMWQLMSETARDAGLRVDTWVDERRDPVRSTDAAIRFLRWLRSEFGSLYLAAAAYNGGPGRISRGLTRFAPDMEGSTGDGFFTLAAQDYLPSETKEYVPKLIAAALVAKDPARYGLRVRPRPAFAYDSVRVPALTALAAVARASGSTVDEILDLNPHYLRGVVPPKGASLVRVPVGRAAAFDSAFEAIPAAERSGVTRVTTKKKQTLPEFARSVGRPAALIAAYNPRLEYGKKKRLHVGQTILVPTRAAAAAARDVPAPPAERRTAPRGAANRGGAKQAAAKEAAAKRAPAKRAAAKAPAGARPAARSSTAHATEAAGPRARPARRGAARGAPVRPAAARRTSAARVANAAPAKKSGATKKAAAPDRTKSK